LSIELHKRTTQENYTRVCDGCHTINDLTIQTESEQLKIDSS